MAAKEVGKRSSEGSAGRSADKGSDRFSPAALDTVAGLLAGRLKRAGIRTDRPETYFQCRAEEAEPFPGGFQVRVHTWRHWSDAQVDLHAEDGELMGYSVARYADPPNEGEMAREQALAAAAEAVKIPPDAVLHAFHHFEYAPRHRLARLEWRRVHQGLPVDGDYLWVSIHPQTLRIVEFARKWRTLRLK